MGKEAFEQLRGFWILEMGELTALKKAEVESIKHFTSKMEDNPLSGLIEDYLDRLLPENWADYDITQRRQFINGTEFGDPVEGSVERTRVCAVEIWVELLGHERGDFPMREAREIKSILAALPEWEPGKTRMRFGKLYGSQAGFVRRIEKKTLNTPESL